ncbi:MAG: VIT1/CCC1 family protein [Planctomycetes bacterium]|nr:VIT1/CCC1 family protein [Planctomycetota bacterium]MCC8117051.1 VIT1/CCC1 family protein [Planctomycetota bacterium]
MVEISPQLREGLLRYQKDELTGAIIYRRMAGREKDLSNKAILENMARDEQAHEAVFRKYSGEEVRTDRWKIIWYTVLGYVLGYTFVIQLMERDEAFTAREYESMILELPELRKIKEDEERHEAKLRSMLDEERLRYVGAMVLGLNDALVELTGTIAGLTLALADNRLVALAGIVTGVSATLSMAASNYLAERADGNPDALKASVYTGVAYLITVVLLVLPYLVFPSDMYLSALFTMLVVVVLVILAFNYYISVARAEPLWPRFREMAAISLGVAVISFVIGLVAKAVLGVEL